LLVTLIGWVCAGCTVHFFWKFFHNPQFLLGPISPFLLPSQDNSWKKPVRSAYCLAVWMGTAYCIYKGAQATLDWMPKSWTVMNDGEPELVRDSLALTLAGIGSLLLIIGLLNVAERLVEAERSLKRIERE